MPNSLAHHLAEHTYVYEFHTHICDAHTKSTPNFHKNLELLVVMDGSCTLTVSDRVYIITEGEAAFIMPYQIHHFVVSDGGHISCTTFHESLVNTLYETIKENKPVTPVFVPTKPTYDYFLGQICTLFGKNSGEQRLISPHAKRLKVKGLLYSLESEFIEQVSFDRTGDFENTTTTVLSFVSENFKENISLKDIANRIGYNYQYISRTFNGMMGMSFKKLLNLHRMEYAFYVLRDTDRPITDIAYESGFQSVRSFYRVCFEIYGCSPMDLRKRERQI